MPLFLIRTAKAVRRDQWDGPDRTRPLIEAGRAQADAIAQWLAAVTVPHILSSPATRCVETVSPLATGREVEVETYRSLGPTKDVEPILAWIRVLPDDCVLC